MGSLSFDAPHRLWLLIIPIAMVVAYLVMQRRRRSYAVRFTNVDLLDSVAPDRPGWRRHLPALLLLFALVVGAMGFAKPARAEEVAQQGRRRHARDRHVAVDGSDRCEPHPDRRGQGGRNVVPEDDP